MPNTLEFLTANDQALLTSKAQNMTFTPGQSIIQEGMPGKAVYLLRTGSAAVQRGGVKIASLGAGDVCGEMAFLEGSSSSASVVAESAVTADAIDTLELQRIFVAFPHLAARFYRSIAVTLSRRLRETSRQLSKAQPSAK